MRSKTTREICATCEYWTGKRKPVFDSNGVAKIDIIDRAGDCEEVNSRFFEKTRENDRRCNRYSKWTEIL